MRVEAEECQDTEDATKNLNQTISRQPGLKSLYSHRSRKRTRTDGSDSANTGGRGTEAADHANLRAHGYEVTPEDIVRDDGIVLEPIFKVW